MPQSPPRPPSGNSPRNNPHGDRSEQSLSPNRRSPIYPYRDRLQGLGRLPSTRELFPSVPLSRHASVPRDERQNRRLPPPVLSSHYSLELLMPNGGRSTWKAELIRLAAQTTPRNVETRQELPPISELFQTVDSSTRRPDHNNYSLERRENGIYTPQPGPYQYQPRYDRRSSLRAEFEPRIAVGEQYSRNVAVASSHDGHSHPGHHHAPPFAREAHVHPHAPQVQHVMAPYPYPGAYYESQYPHPPNVFFHAESGQYVQAWSGGEGNPHDPYAGRKRRGNLPKEATNLLKRWFADHGDSPYPSEEEKQNLSIATGLGLNQISNWFINARRRQPGRDAREALLREQELRKEQLSRQQQSQSGASSQLSSTPSPTDDSTSSGSVASSIEQDRRQSRYDAPGRSSPPRTRSTAGMSSPYSSGAATRHSERHAALHRSSRRSSTPESRRERRHR